MPFSLNEKFSLITRYIVPIIAQYDVTGEGTQQSGLSDALVSGWLSNAVVKMDLYGVLEGLFTAYSYRRLSGNQQIRIGANGNCPSAKNGFTYGILMNQVWSVAGDEDRPDVNQMYLQPVLSYNWKSGTVLTLNSETTVFWATNNANAFINIMAGGLLKFGKQLMQFQIGPAFMWLPRRRKICIWC